MLSRTLPPLVLVAAANAQVVPTTVLRATAAVPGIPNFEFNGAEWLGSNHDGGLVANITANDNGNFVEFLWGSVGGGALGELRREGSQGSIDVTSIDRACAGAGTSQVYLGTVTGQGDSIIVDGTVIATVGDATAPGGATWFRFEEPFLDQTGTVWFRGRYTTANGSPWGLFRGASLQPMITAGDGIIGYPAQVSGSGAPEPAHDVSPLGSHWMCRANTTNFRTVIVRDNEVLSSGGVPLVTGNVLPPAYQLHANEAYNVFGQVQVGEGERWAVIAGTPAGLILRDDNLFVRNGNIVDGHILSGDFRGIAMNRFGGLAWIGRVDLGMNDFRWAVFKERTLLYMEGDPVDIDFDGVPDAGWAIAEIIGSERRLAYTEDGTVWATVRLSTPMGGSPFAVVGAGESFGRPYCGSVVNSSGRGALMQAVGSPVLAENDLHLRCVNMPTTTFGYFLGSRTQGFVANAGGSQGNLCLAGAVGRFNANIENSGDIGSIELSIDLQAIPQPNGAVSAMVGDDWNFQCWFRDANPSVTSNFSDGIEITIR